MTIPQIHTFHCVTDVRLSLLHSLLSPLAWIVVVIIFVGTNPGPAHSQLSPMLYPNTGGTNAMLYGTKQLALYPMAMMSSQFGNTGFGVPGMSPFGTSGSYAPTSSAQFGFNQPRPMMPQQSMMGAFPQNNMARPMTNGQFGASPMQSMSSGGSMQPSMMGSNSFGQPPKPNTGMSGGYPSSGNMMGNSMANMGNMGRPPGGQANMGFGGNMMGMMNNTRGFGAPGTPRYF